MGDVVNGCVHDNLSCKKVPCSSDADFKEFSTGHGGGIGLNCLWNITTLGIYGDVKCKKDPSDVLKGILSGGMSNTCIAAVGAELVQTKGQKDADQWNALDPNKLFPFPANASCDQLNNYIASLEQELVTTDAKSAGQNARAKNAASNYKGKVSVLLAKANATFANNNCPTVLKQEAAAVQCKIDATAALNAMKLTQQQSNTNSASTSVNILTISLIGGAVLLVSIIGLALYNKKGTKPTSATTER